MYKTGQIKTSWFSQVLEEVKNREKMWQEIIKKLKLWEDKRNLECLHIGPHKWKLCLKKNKTVTDTIMTQLIKNDQKLWIKISSK